MPGAADGAATGAGHPRDPLADACLDRIVEPGPGGVVGVRPAVDRVAVTDRGREEQIVAVAALQLVEPLVVEHGVVASERAQIVGAGRRHTRVVDQHVLAQRAPGEPVTAGAAGEDHRGRGRERARPDVVTVRGAVEDDRIERLSEGADRLGRRRDRAAARGRGALVEDGRAGDDGECHGLRRPPSVGGREVVGEAAPGEVDLAVVGVLGRQQTDRDLRRVAEDDAPRVRGRLAGGPGRRVGAVVGPGAAVERIRSRSAVEVVAVGAAVDGVVAAAGEDDVSAASPVDRVGARGADDVVGERGADHVLEAGAGEPGVEAAAEAGEAVVADALAEVDVDAPLSARAGEAGVARREVRVARPLGEAGRDPGRVAERVGTAAAVLDLVGGAVAADVVVPRLPVDGVPSPAAGEQVAVVAAVDGVVADAAVEPVLALVSVEHVIAALSIDDVVAGAAVESLAAEPEMTAGGAVGERRRHVAHEDVVARAPGHGRPGRVGGRVDPVVSPTPEDGVDAGRNVDRVVPPATVDLVRAGFGDEDVGAGGALRAANRLPVCTVRRTGLCPGDQYARHAADQRSHEKRPSPAYGGTENGDRSPFEVTAAAASCPRIQGNRVRVSVMRFEGPGASG